jgi:hypothetical protein
MANHILPNKFYNDLSKFVKKPSKQGQDWASARSLDNPLSFCEAVTENSLGGPQADALLKYALP